MVIGHINYHIRKYLNIKRQGWFIQIEINSMDIIWILYDLPRNKGVFDVLNRK